MTTSKLRRLLILLFVCILATNAQFNSTIDGAVTDHTGDAVPDAAVKVTNITCLTSGTFGKSTATYTPRAVQFALRRQF
jgi:hypothetical protein